MGQQTRPNNVVHRPYLCNMELSADLSANLATMWPKYAKVLYYHHTRFGNSMFIRSLLQCTPVKRKQSDALNRKFMINTTKYWAQNKY